CCLIPIAIILTLLLVNVESIYLFFLLILLCPLMYLLLMMLRKKRANYHKNRLTFYRPPLM
ncbi:MAG: hypothetical protein ACE5K4_12935, partial [Candidatus Hydrothermarchaeota archaeon]